MEEFYEEDEDIEAEGLDEDQPERDGQLSAKLRLLVDLEVARLFDYYFSPFSRWRRLHGPPFIPRMLREIPWPDARRLAPPIHRGRAHNRGGIYRPKLFPDLPEQRYKPEDWIGAGEEAWDEPDQGQMFTRDEEKDEIEEAVIEEGMASLYEEAEAIASFEEEALGKDPFMDIEEDPVTMDEPIADEPGELSPVGNEQGIRADPVESFDPLLSEVGIGLGQDPLLPIPGSEFEQVLGDEPLIPGDPGLNNPLAMGPMPLANDPFDNSMSPPPPGMEDMDDLSDPGF